jgi:thioredoxin-like negative regulator of GroEL
LGIGTGLVSCGTKKTVKQAEKYETAGMFREASELYYQAHIKKPQKADISIALKRTGQIYLEELSQNISISFTQGNYKETVYQYLAARNLITRLRQAGIELKPDDLMKRHFEDAKEIYLAGRYKLGQKNIYDLNYKEAKAVFKEIYNIDPDYRDTRNYLDQATYEPVYLEGSQLYAEGDYIGAYDMWEYIYLSVSNYKDVKKLMGQALNERYKEGSLLLIDENFNDAAEALGQVFHRDPAYKDVKTLYTEARNEPVYRQAAVWIEEEKCRSAYYAYEQIIADAGKYKDADKLKDDALECAQYPIAIQTPVIRKSKSQANSFLSLLNNKLLKLKSPFLKIYNLSAINSRLDESLKGPAGHIDHKVLRNLYVQNNIKAILVCEFTKFETVTGKENREQQTGFERLVMKSASGETTIYDKRVKYTEVSRENRVAVSLTFKLISTETGEILLSDRAGKNEEERTEYATYSGNKDKLYPATYSNGAYSLNENGYRKLQKLLKEPHDIRSTNELVNSAFKDITKNIAVEIDNFNPEE